VLTLEWSLHPEHKTDELHEAFSTVVVDGRVVGRLRLTAWRMAERFSEGIEYNWHVEVDTGEVDTADVYIALADSEAEVSHRTLVEAQEAAESSLPAATTAYLATLAQG
jgi:ethanolamine utilization protein EutP (predicted NTPase)